MKTSPTQRSLKMLRDQGFTVAITERWNPHAHIRQDLFGFIDLLCISPGVPPRAVQTTSGANAAARCAKVIAEPRAKTWLETGCTIDIHSWRKVGARGKRKLWECDVRPITLGMIP